MPNLTTVHAGLAREGVTLQLLWQDYEAQSPDGYQYTQFSRHDTGRSSLRKSCCWAALHSCWARFCPKLGSGCARSRSSPPIPLALPDEHHSAIDFSMLDWTTCPAVERVPGRVSGEWLFRGTRVPVRALFENLEGGASVPEFLTWFPGVTREQVDAVLEHASRSLAVSA